MLQFVFRLLYKNIEHTIWTLLFWKSKTNKLTKTVSCYQKRQYNKKADTNSKIYRNTLEIFNYSLLITSQNLWWSNRPVSVVVVVFFLWHVNIAWHSVCSTKGLALCGISTWGKILFITYSKTYRISLITILSFSSVLTVPLERPN